MTDEGDFKPLFRIAYSKPTKQFVAKNEKKSKDYSYLYPIIDAIVERARCGQKVTTEEREPRLMRSTICPEDRPTRDKIIENSIKYSRLGF